MNETKPTNLADAVERLIRVGVALTTRALSDEPGVELTVQQWRVLVLVAEGDELRVGEVAARVGLSFPSASRLVGRLEAAGLVRHDRDPDDRRAALVVATATGRGVANAVVARRRALIAGALEAAGPFEEPVSAAIERLGRALDHLA